MFFLMSISKKTTFFDEENHPTEIFSSGKVLYFLSILNNGPGHTISSTQPKQP